MACPIRFAGALAQRPALGHGDLRRDQIDAEDLLGDRVLHLQSGVHLQEEHAFPIDQELHRAGADVADGGGSGSGCVVQRGAGGVRQIRRGCLLDDLLVTPLDRAVAVADDPHGAVGVGHDLHLDVPGTRQIGLDEHGLVAEGRAGLGSGRRHLADQVGRVGDDAHAAAAASCRCLDQQREVVGRRGVRVDAQDRHASLGHQLLGPDLGAHLVDGVGVRTDPGQPSRLHLTGEVGVLGQEAVTGMDRIGTGLPGRLRSRGLRADTCLRVRCPGDEQPGPPRARTGRPHPRRSGPPRSPARDRDTCETPAARSPRGWPPGQT